MKNKRKYDDAIPATAAEISKKNLGKLQKLTKVDPPKVKAIKASVNLFLADRKNSNSLLEILGHLDVSEPGSVVTAALQGLKRIFLMEMQSSQFKKSKGSAEAEGPEAEFSKWLQDRFQDGVKSTCELVFHKKRSVSHLAIATLFNLIQAQNSATQGSSGEWSMKDIGILQELLLSLTSNRVSARIPLSKMKEYLIYSDVSFHFVSILAKIVNKAVKSEKTNFTFVENVIAFLEAFDMTDKEKYSERPVYLRESTAAGPVKLEYETLRKNFGSIWINILKCKFQLDQYKRTLIMLNEKVIPLLPRPLLLTDFLMNCFSVGGAISILALSGVFTLISKYNLDYPDFYTKLYELFTVEIFFVKYKARFFHLSDIFLSSTHLPQQLVAAFVKRVARLSLQAPAHSLPLCIRFVHNLIHRHRGLDFLLDSPDRINLYSDPYILEERDPTLCKATESSLWEIKSLASHLLPEVSSAAKDLLERGVREEERKLPDVLETNWSDLMEIEFKKKIFVNVPVNFEAPDGLKMAKNDMLSEIFEFV